MGFPEGKAKCYQELLPLPLCDYCYTTGFTLQIVSVTNIPCFAKQKVAAFISPRAEKQVPNLMLQKDILKQKTFLSLLTILYC